MATTEDSGAVITWAVLCVTCQKIVDEGTGTPPDVADLKQGSLASRHVHEAGGTPHQFQIRRRGRVTEAQANFYL